MNFQQTFVALPPELKAYIAIAVLAVVRLVLQGRVADEWASELAAVITTAVVALIELGLKLIPGNFDSVVASVLNLLVVLLGTVFVYRGYIYVRHALKNAKSEVKHLM